MQFTEMAKVTSFVDNKMISDLRQWLMDRRDQKGGFLTNPKALDTFGRAPPNVTNAYIVWTLSSSLGEDGLKKEDL